jgi:NDP-sugar pyrophosphorylase family protein
MAAGMGSRYGGIKQIDGFGPNGETIMDYSLYDALRSGFTKVVFIVREEIQETVKEIFVPKLKGKIEVHFVNQTLNKFVPAKFGTPDRKKPWGTTHAILCGKEAINEPFAVINADDFYGREAFDSLANFLRNAQPGNHCMVGYQLKNVMSEYGSVSRGYAETDANNLLTKMTELTKIVRENGKIISKEATGDRELNPDAPISMNCWGFLPDALDISEKFFHEFLEKEFRSPTSEYYIALMVTAMIERRLGKVHVIPGGKKWFGVTYKEDKEFVANSIKKLVESGEYPSKLW